MVEAVNNLPFPYWSKQSATTRRLIVIDALNTQGDSKIFAWYTNLPLESKDPGYQRRGLAILVARIYLAWRIDAAIGPGIDFYRSRLRETHESVSIDHTCVGLYIDVNEHDRYKALRPISTPPFVELKRQHGKLLAETVVAKALHVLPRGKLV